MNAINPKNSSINDWKISYINLFNYFYFLFKYPFQYLFISILIYTYLFISYLNTYVKLKDITFLPIYEEGTAFLRIYEVVKLESF